MYSVSSLSHIAGKSWLGVFEGRLALKIPYHQELLDEVRCLPGRVWDSRAKAHYIPTDAVVPVVALCEKWGIPMSPAIAQIPRVEAPPLELDGLSVDGSTVAIRFAYSPEDVASIKRAVPSAMWSPAKKKWTTGIENLADAVAWCNRKQLPVPLDIQELAEDAIQEAKSLFDASYALDAITPAAVESVVPLWPYQLAGVEYVRRSRRVILGDEVGLGKTAIALAAAVAEDCLPCVVVTPLTLLPNWAEVEIPKFFPHLTVSMIRSGKPEPLPEVDITIINYDLVLKRADDLLVLGPKALICDESHAIRHGEQKHLCPLCKNKVRVNARRCPTCRQKIDGPEETWTVQRAAGVMKIARAIPDDGMVVLCTATAITSRPVELQPQLQAIGRLDLFGGPWRFRKRYCGGDGSGASNVEELNRRLRETGSYLRRKKSDIYADLPPLIESRQFLDVGKDKLRDYRTAENDVVEFLATRAAELALEVGEDADAAYWQKRLRAEAAEHLVRIAALKMAVLDAKLDSVLEWIDSWLDSSDDQKLIVFAEHIAMVEAIAKRFGDRCVKIRGGVSASDRALAVKSFQEDPSVRLFVGNIAAASEGLTLTAASAIAMCELPWTPSAVSQCVGRAYARANDMHGIVLYELLVPDTIDTDISSLLSAKAKVVSAVLDGETPEAQRSVLSDLVVEMASRRMGAFRKEAA